MNAQQLLDQILRHMRDIVSDRDKLAKLLDFMNKENLRDNTAGQHKYENAEQLLDKIFMRLSFIKSDENKLAELLDFMEKANFLDDEDDEDENKTKFPKKYRKIVKQIADNLSVNSISFFNPDTLEVEGVYKDLFNEMIFDDYEDDEENEFGLTFMKWENCVKIEPLESRESFQIMENFVNQLKSGKKADRLAQALNGRKPFANFNNVIHNSEYREDWFAFRQKELEKYVILRYFYK
ncbi:MAG: UPF0158 family protein [Prevotellaceae bacterium]|jgi:hypothetical protein|nr:UPF0158 family protein [Prevotellaceae bacterium]